VKDSIKTKKEAGCTQSASTFTPSLASISCRSFLPANWKFFDGDFLVLASCDYLFLPNPLEPFQRLTGHCNGADQTLIVKAPIPSSSNQAISLLKMKKPCTFWALSLISGLLPAFVRANNAHSFSNLSRCRFSCHLAAIQTYTPEVTLTGTWFRWTSSFHLFGILGVFAPTFLHSWHWSFWFGSQMRLDFSVLQWLQHYNIEIIESDFYAQ